VPPQVGLDHTRWVSLWNRLGAQGSGRSIFAHLAQSYAEPIRAYHNTAHIRDCLSQLDLSRELARRPDQVEAAIWFHDAVYVPGASDNEHRSARLAEISLVACAVSLEVARRIGELILATRHVTLPTDFDSQLLCDIDLSILGRAVGEFDDFERAIRQEYAQVPEADYRRERSAVLAGLLRREVLYQTGYFRNRFEEQARTNLQRALAALAS
jgi:predicted metal-dependent HD superfamily phosphohydrolase